MSKSTARDDQSSGPVDDEVQGLETIRTKVDMPRDEAEKTGPLGLRLTKTPSFLELIETKLKAPPRHEPEKFKASAVSAISLQIGSWKVVSSNECNVVAKFYYGKKRIVWEILVDGMKRKMEIAWLIISGITASFAEGKDDTLEIQLEKPPNFFAEKDSQPGRNTKWAAADDFTGGYAQIYKRHFAVFNEGTLEDNHTKLLHSDDRLCRLSQRSFSAFGPSMFFDAVPIETQHDLVRQSSMQDLFVPFQTIEALTDDSMAYQSSLAHLTPLQTTPVQEMGVMGLSSVQAVSAPAEDLVSYRSSDSWDDPVNLGHLSPFFQATPSFSPVPLEATTMLETGNCLIDNVYATVLPGLPKDVPIWNGALQEDQVQYAAPFSGQPRPVIEPAGLAPFYVGERSFGSSMDVTVQAAAREELRSGGDGEYSLGDPNLAMAPTVHCPDGAQVLKPASSFMCINDGRPNSSF